MDGRTLLDQINQARLNQSAAAIICILQSSDVHLLAYEDQHDLYVNTLQRAANDQFSKDLWSLNAIDVFHKAFPNYRSTVLSLKPKDCRTYRITLPHDCFFVFTDCRLGSDAKSFQITTGYSSTFEGYPCGTQPPPSPNMLISNDETKILSCTKISTHLVVANVEFVPQVSSVPNVQEINLLTLLRCQ
jgi:hypothetical protein